jgi:hypothetical protein
MKPKLSTNKFTAIIFLASLLGCSSKSSKPTDSSVSSQSHVGIPAEMNVEQEFLIGNAIYQRQPWRTDGGYSINQYYLWQNAMAVCMKAKGFTYEPDLSEDKDESRSTVMHPLNIATARIWGYHEPPYFDLSPDPPLSEPAKKALYSNRGCGEVGHEYAAPKEVKEYGNFLSSLTVRSQIGGYEQLPDGLALMAQWSDCMKEKGYQFTDQDAASGKYDSDDPASKPTEEEIRVRLEDIACDRKVGFSKSKSVYQTAKYKKWEDENAETIKRVIELRDAAIRIVTERTVTLERDGAKALGM